VTGELVKVTGVAEFMRASKAKNTQAAYASDLKDFERWCRSTTELQGVQVQPLPASPETVATYLAALAGSHKFATIRRRAAALAFAHRSVGAYNPLDHQGVKDTLAGIARTLGRAPVKKAALTAELLAKAVRKIPVERHSRVRLPVRATRAPLGPPAPDAGPTLAPGGPTPVSSLSRPPAPDLPGPDPGLEPGLPGAARPAEPRSTCRKVSVEGEKLQVADLAGLRDRALLLLGFAGALRRSEIVDLDVNDVARHSKGALIIVRRSKTDQTGAGLTKAIPHGKKLKAIEALDSWLIAGKITEGPIFRAVHGRFVSDQRLTAGQVARIIKKRAAAIGLDPKFFSGHSLRSGYASTAADHGAELGSIANHLGHSKLDTTRAYVQIADSFRSHSGRKFL
jgi:site-specific recombinase XerD